MKNEIFNLVSNTPYIHINRKIKLWSTKGQIVVKTVESGWNLSQPVYFSQNIYKIHMSRLKILWRIQIQGYLRSIQVTKSHQRSNFGQIRQIRVRFGRLVKMYTKYILFDSEFYRQFNIKIIGGQFRS